MKKALVITLIISIFLILGVGGYFLIKGTPQYIVSGGQTKLAIPHFASYKCDVIEDVRGQEVTIPKGGTLISKSTVGYYTNGISNIKGSYSSSFLSLYSTWGTRAVYQICDVNGNNCGSDITSKLSVGSGKYTFPINSLDFTKESMKIRLEVLPIYLVGGWKPVEGLKLSFDAKKFGLTLSSTTQDPAGKVICSTSCDLSCPDIGYRQDLVVTDKDVLGFYQTAPYLEYWESIDYDLNAQGGATVYNANTNTFCLAGAVYTGKTLNLGSGTYIYPNTNTKQNLICCPGARISSTNSDKICQSDGTWKIIQDTDKLTCLSDINCPGAGNNICQNKQLSSGYSCDNKDSNGIGVCQISSSNPVQCCTSSDCNRDQVCDTISNTCKGGTSLPICGNNLVEKGEECDDGNQIGGDGCNSICQIEQGNEDCNNGKDDDGDSLVDKADPDCQNNLECNPPFKVLVEKETCQGNPLCWIGVTKPKTIQKCRTAGWLILTIIGLILAIIIVSLVLIKRMSRR